MGTSAHTPISYITAVAMEVKLLIVGTWKNEMVEFLLCSSLAECYGSEEKSVMSLFMIGQYNRQTVFG